MKFNSQPPRPLEIAARSASRLMDLLVRTRRAMKAVAVVSQFGSHGRGFRFDPDGIYSYGSIHVGDNVDLGYRPILVATRSTIRIGSNVMFGPEVTIRGGNHRTDIADIPMTMVTDDMKRARDDLGVVVEDDVWIGTRAVILHGVRIGRGSVIGAGSVVTKSVDPYSVVCGNPARLIRGRFEASAE